MVFEVQALAIRLFVMGEAVGCSGAALIVMALRNVAIVTVIRYLLRRVNISSYGAPSVDSPTKYKVCSHAVTHPKLLTITGMPGLEGHEAATTICCNNE